MESDRICNCKWKPEPHPAHSTCACGQPDNCRWERDSGLPLLHKGQPGYEEAEERILAAGRRGLKEARRESRKGVFRDFWHVVTTMGVLSTDPSINRPAMFLTGQRLLQAQAQQRLEDEALAEDRMRRQAELTAELTAQALARVAAEQRAVR